MTKRFPRRHCCNYPASAWALLRLFLKSRILRHLRLVVFPPVDKKLHHDLAELSPRFLITIDNNWQPLDSASDILQPLERGAEASFGLCVNRKT